MTSGVSAPCVALAGNPNAGKTTLFNRLTGSRAKVGNYPGVTVERSVGRWRAPEFGEVELMDVPGMVSLSTRSAEERVAFAAVAGLPPHERPAAIVVVVDVCELSRQLYLALQVIELGLPTVVALSMVDQLAAAGKSVDTEVLGTALGVPVVSLHGAGRDARTLALAVSRVLEDPPRPPERVAWETESEPLRRDVDAVSGTVPDSWHRGNERLRRLLALWALISTGDPEECADDETPGPLLAVVAERRSAAEAAGRDVDEEVVRSRYAWIDAHLDEFIGTHEPSDPDAEPAVATDRIDRVLLHPVFGFAIFLVVMTMLFQSLFTFADPMIGWIEDGVVGIGRVAGSVLPAGLVHDFLVDGVIAGVGAVLVFLPQILLLFFFIAILEGSGYMARVAFLMDRVMRVVGLHGRAFIPMLSGFACAVPAILATRTIERRRDRFLTILVVPLMTCSARLPVYGLLIAALYPPDAERPFVQGMLMVAMYVFSTIVALAAAAILGRTVLRGPKVPLILQMPRYRMPALRSVLREMYDRSMVFVKEAGTVILVCTIVMWALLTFPREPELDVDYGAERSAVVATAAAESRDAGWLAARHEEIDSAEQGERMRKSIAGRLGHVFEPVIEPLGFDWKVGIGLIGAFAAREVFVSTMAVVYGLEEGTAEDSMTLRERVRDHRWADGARVFTPLVCLSLMVFFALACQCLSTLAAAKRETGGYRWPVFLFVYMTALAWVASFAVYQGGQLLGFV